MKRRWTTREVTFIRELSKRGYSFDEMASVLGRTRNGVAAFAQRIGVKSGKQRRPYTEAQLRVIESAMLNTVDYVADRLGRTRNAIIRQSIHLLIIRSKRERIRERARKMMEVA